VRSQMDIRICFRVRERKDVDLSSVKECSRRMHAHTLKRPGKFLISRPSTTHTAVPAIFCSRETVSATARPPHTGSRNRPGSLDDTRIPDPGAPPDDPNRADGKWSTALTRLQDGMTTRTTREPTDHTATRSHPVGGPVAAPDDGVPVPDLMGRHPDEPPVGLSAAPRDGRSGRVAQVGRGRWRAVMSHPQ